MGAVCAKKGDAVPKTRQPPVEVKEDSPDAAPQEGAAADGAAAAPAKKANEFIPGDGDGVYLILAAEGNGTLIQQYAHQKPEVAEGDALLLQVKPPIYVEIKESRYTLQGGKRILKTSLPMAMNSKDGKKKVSEAILEFLRLAPVYSAHFFAYPALADAPFQVALVVTEKHLPCYLKDHSSGCKVAPAASEAGEKKEGEAAPDAAAKDDKKPDEEGKAEDAKKEEGKAEDKAEAKEADKEAGKDAALEAVKQEAIEASNDDVPECEVPLPKAESLDVIRHLTCGLSAGSSYMKWILVLPVDRAKAEETLIEGRVVEADDVEPLKKTVEGLGGIMATPSADAAA